MNNSSYDQIKISIAEAESILFDSYGHKGILKPLPGELDMNFKVLTEDDCYVLKISRPGVDMEFIGFQNKILAHLDGFDNIESPKVIKGLNNEDLSEFVDKNGNTRIVRLYSWISGRLWSSVNPINARQLHSLGKAAGSLTEALQDFDHHYAHRHFEWDLATISWTKEYIDHFSPEEKELLEPFHTHFGEVIQKMKSMRQAVIHNDVNDYNIVVTDNLLHPEVKGVIDFGDAIHTSVINDLAITLAYALMDMPDPLGAAIPLVRGYHESFKLKEEELEILYWLVAMRLIISLTKSAINKRNEPENEYLLISERPAWELLKKWKDIDPNFAHCCFRQACSYPAHPSYKDFKSFAETNSINMKQMLPTTAFDRISGIDMSVGSRWLGSKADYENPESFTQKLKILRDTKARTLFAGGYGEIRPLYSTEQYKTEGNEGPEYRSMHLGIDIWLEEGTPIHAPINGTVFSFHNNNDEKDYGPTLIMEHKYGGGGFYSLYGHLGMQGFELVRPGQEIKKGDLIGIVGGHHENGGWAPHLHFQLMLDMLGNTHNFPGVALSRLRDVWFELCPDPALLIDEIVYKDTKSEGSEEIVMYRQEHLGKSLSLSYDGPLHMLRGEGAFLIDQHGRKYLDTVNNVAHVGHEHPRVVRAGQEQMAILNTNTRYLHSNINEFAKELLSTFPPELAVVHFVNSGSEANELAMRMAKTHTAQKDMIAVEVGYHGNTGACIDISSYKFDGKGGKGAPEHTHIVPMPDSFRGKYQGDNTGNKYAAHIQQKINDIRKKDRDVAAFICESIISCGGQVELPEGFLKEAYKYVHDAGGLCIADEVQVGCGRVGSAFWGFQLHDVVPDIVTIGKPIGNGHPLAAVVCTRQVAESFANGMEYFNTFGGNPVSCAIGKEVLSVVRDEMLQKNALEVGNYLKAGLLKLQNKNQIIADVRGQGLFLGFELCNKEKAPLGTHAEYLANRMKDLGILMSTDGPDHNVIKIKPPMVFSKANADELLLRLNQVLEEDFMRLYDA